MNFDEDKKFLSDWIVKRLPFLRSYNFLNQIGSSEVTVLAYHFWNKDQIDIAFDAVECSICETWFHCGIMKTVLVVNQVTPHLETFAEKYSPWVKLVEEKRLIPGKIFSMSEDCNSRLYTRFDTPSVLIVQNDGFPLQSGLNQFIGKYDFIGAPYIRNIWWKRAICSLLKYWVSNGGFSLRSHEICEKASYYWNQKYYKLSDCNATSEDLFYTKTLLLHERKYRQNVKIANCREAIRFSYDGLMPFKKIPMPFGFHGARAFRLLKQMNSGLLPEGNRSNS